MVDTKRLRNTIIELIENQADDQRLRDHLEGVMRDPQFPSLTWFWAPKLYERNRALFRNIILRYFSEWERTRFGWRRAKWSDHESVLEPWLQSARQSRDIQLVRLLLRWKYASNRWGVDPKKWSRALLSEFQSVATPAERAIVLEEYDDWFELDEETALALYQTTTTTSDFILKHLARTMWGWEKRRLWEGLSRAARHANDQKLWVELYRRQVPLKQWRTDVLQLAQSTQDSKQLCEELEQRHPVGYGLKVGETIVKLLEVRGRDVMPYVRSKLPQVVNGWERDNATPIVAIAEKHGWWDLWTAAIRTDRSNAKLNAAVVRLIDADASSPEFERMERLRALAGVSREWNWSGIGFAQVHALKDEVAEKLYRRYPDLIRGPYKPHVTPTWWQGYPLLLTAAREAGDTELVDLMASRYVTQVCYEHAYYGQKNQEQIIKTANSLADMYQALRDQHQDEFALRAANVLTRIPAFAIHDYNQLLKSNRLARLLFVRSFEPLLASSAALHDLVEGSEIHVQRLAYQVLALDDDRARNMARETLDILIGTLLRPLHRKTRIAAFGALWRAAQADKEAAAVILRRSRDAIRLPDKHYPKEKLINLIGKILHCHPELRGDNEGSTVYGIVEVVP